MTCFMTFRFNVSCVAVNRIQTLYPQSIVKWQQRSWRFAENRILISDLQAGLFVCAHACCRRNWITEMAANIP
jgi:hypothetical protein